MMTTILLLAAALVQAADGPQPDRWHGLILESSSPDDAIKVLGKPKEDKPGRLMIREIDKWFEPGLNKKNFRKQTFREVSGFDRVDLYYREDKLMAIQLDPDKDIHPNALPNIYGLEFAPFLDALTETMFPRDFERHKGKVYPKKYPITYYLVATSPKSVIAAEILNGGVGRTLRSMAIAVDAPGSGFPGKVHYIQLISRKLENRQGADLLK